MKNISYRPEKKACSVHPVLYGNSLSYSQAIEQGHQWHTASWVRRTPVPISQQGTQVFSRTALRLSRWRRLSSTMIQTTTKWRWLDCKPWCLFSIKENLRTDCYHDMLDFQTLSGFKYILIPIYLGALRVERKTCGSQQLIHCHSMQIDYKFLQVWLCSILQCWSCSSSNLADNSSRMPTSMMSNRMTNHLPSVELECGPKCTHRTLVIFHEFWKTSGKCAVPS